MGLMQVVFGLSDFECGDVLFEEMVVCVMGIVMLNLQVLMGVELIVLDIEVFGDYVEMFFVELWCLLFIVGFFVVFDNVVVIWWYFGCWVVWEIVVVSMCGFCEMFDVCVF